MHQSFHLAVARLFLAVLVVVGSLSVTSLALAWDGFGHMTVAAIAWEKFTPTARLKATTLVNLNPMYDQWVAGIAGLSSTTSKPVFRRGAL